MSEKRRGARAKRSAQNQARADLVHEVEQLELREPGGSPQRPILVSSPTLVDVMAVSTPCPLCEGALHLEEHAAETIDGVPLRVARLRCAACGVRRARYFQLGERPLH